MQRLSIQNSWPPISSLSTLPISTILPLKPTVEGPLEVVWMMGLPMTCTCTPPMVPEAAANSP